MPSEHKVM